MSDSVTIEQSIGTFEGTKNINVGGGEAMGDVQAGLEFIYHMREHLLDVGVATIYCLVVYAIVLWIKKRFSDD